MASLRELVDRYTCILEFEVVKPLDELETPGERLKLSMFGEYCPDNSLRGYSLHHLITNRSHYRVSKIIQKGEVIEIPVLTETTAH